ncbi:MAG TPA: hypothetical protein VFS08_09205 [Gemmatimonadaceae bacterium]|nr:hypothetical protein [Gemmatimonadaceae bacterium]
MPSARDDFFVRTIREVAEAVRRIRARLGGGASADEVVPEIQAAEGMLLGGRGALLRVLDARSAAQLLGDPDAARLWVELLRLEAEAHRRGGREAAAQALEARAAELLRHLPDA